MTRTQIAPTDHFESLRKPFGVACVQALAQVIHSTDFDTKYNSSTAARVLGGDTPDVVAGQWFGSCGIAGCSCS